jgi:HD-GYP domain-containing protein (c-di-GMP phosphodiesterase class II)
MSLNIKMGGKGGKISWPPIQLTDEAGVENHANVSTHVALTGETVNIPDVYDVKGFDFQGTKEFDKKTTYRSKSMLMVPLRNHENEIIGVLQLINASDTHDKSVVPFSAEAQSMTLSLASQAAVAITKNRLILELENLFESFIRTIAKAVDEKSPYTGGHVKRVADIALMIAEKINEKKEGIFSNIAFHDDQLKELRIAAWLHDIGKVTTPEYVVDKATKLETKYDRIHEIATRFEVLKRDAEIKFLRKTIELMENGGKDAIPQYEEGFRLELKKIEDDFRFIYDTNMGGEFMPDDKVERIKNLSRNTWQNNKSPVPWLTEDEVYNLTIRKGTLTKEEKEIIQNHVRLTESMLRELPFPKKLKNVIEYASSHHETLNGTGYHKGLKGDQISLQARILAFADIFEALSASDRPYKKGKTASEVKKILGFMVKDQHIDKDIYDLFFNDGLFLKYIKESYKPDQIDIPLGA